MVTLVVYQLDKLVLARVFTLQQFGIYAIAANLAVAPASIADRYSSRIFYPAIAATWRTAPQTMKQQYYALRGLLFYAYLLGGGLLIGAAPLVIRILYDPRYIEAGFYLRLLAISTTLVLLTTTANAALVAMGRVSTTLITNLTRLAWLLPAGLAAFFIFGPIGLIVAFSLIDVPALLYMSVVQFTAGLFDFRLELRSWLAIGGGIAAGLACDGLGVLIGV
jgi:O-antigen/teichoic acid export membrane protein